MVMLVYIIYYTDTIWKNWRAGEGEEKEEKVAEELVRQRWEEEKKRGGKR